MSQLNTYDQLNKELAAILQDIQVGKIPLEQLEEYLSKAKLLAEACENKLRSIQNQLESNNN
jgi:exonuclease VII small subunit